MKTINVEQLPEMFQCIGDLFAEKKEELCEMDAKMGDGDLGLTMSKGYGALPGLLKENTETDDVGKTLAKGGMKMSSVVPSTMGTLMSSGILSGGKALKGMAEINAASLVIFLNAFAEGIANRGKCQRGQRTVLDSVGAAADRASEALKADPDADLKKIIDAAVKGAEEGVEATRDMRPVFGKAAVHANAAAGVADQGAVAGLYLLKGMQKYING